MTTDPDQETDALPQAGGRIESAGDDADLEEPSGRTGCDAGIATATPADVVNHPPIQQLLPLTTGFIEGTSGMPLNYHYPNPLTPGSMQDHLQTAYPQMAGVCQLGQEFVPRTVPDHVGPVHGKSISHVGLS